MRRMRVLLYSISKWLLQRQRSNFHSWQCFTGRMFRFQCSIWKTSNGKRLLKYQALCSLCLDKNPIASLSWLYVKLSEMHLMLRTPKNRNYTKQSERCQLLNSPDVTDATLNSFQSVCEACSDLQSPSLLPFDRGKTWEKNGEYTLLLREGK